MVPTAGMGYEQEIVIGSTSNSLTDIFAHSYHISGDIVLITILPGEILSWSLTGVKEIKNPYSEEFK